MDESASNKEIWEVLLLCAESQKSELLYRRALKETEYRYGEESLQSGIVLLALSDFYGKSEREAEAEELEERAYAIMRRFLRKRPGLIETLSEGGWYPRNGMDRGLNSNIISRGMKASKN